MEDHHEQQMIDHGFGNQTWLEQAYRIFYHCNAHHSMGFPGTFEGTRLIKHIGESDWNKNMLHNAASKLGD